MDIKVMTRIYASRFYHSRSKLPDFLYSQSDFYRGKTLRIVRGHDERMEINFVRPISFRIAHQMSVPEENQKRFESCRATPRPSHFLTSLPAQRPSLHANGKAELAVTKEYSSPHQTGYSNRCTIGWTCFLRGQTVFRLLS